IYGNTTFGVKGPDYRIKGVELQLIGRVAPGLTLQGAVSRNKAEEKNNPCIASSNPATNGVANPTPIGQCLTQVWSSSLSQNVPLMNLLGAVGATPAAPSGFMRDRKSTRPDSSHRTISYAFFCFKKATTERTCSFVHNHG